GPNGVSIARDLRAFFQRAELPGNVCDCVFLDDLRGGIGPIEQAKTRCSIAPYSRFDDPRAQDAAVGLAFFAECRVILILHSTLQAACKEAQGSENEYGGSDLKKPATVHGAAPKSNRRTTSAREPQVEESKRLLVQGAASVEELGFGVGVASEVA